jgi:Zn-finger nucleic acid-binding protein
MSDTLECPSCGAPAAADALRCDYCASALKTVTCPSCFASMFAGSQFCPHCGARAAALVEDGGPPLPCPNCNASMKPVRVGVTPMQQCESCAGSWLTTETFTALCTDREAQGAVMSTFGAAGAATGVRLGAVRYRRCAACQQMMNRVNFGRVSGIVVDLCKGHGVWFDANELQAVLAFVGHGGLERMRESDAEFKELSKKAWAAGGGIGGDGQVVPHRFTSETSLHIHLTGGDGDSVPLRQFLELLLT